MLNFPELLAWLLLVSIPLLILKLEVYLSLHKKISVALILPTISLILGFWPIIRFVKYLILKGYFIGEDFYMGLICVMLWVVFVLYRIKVRKKIR